MSDLEDIIKILNQLVIKLDLVICFNQFGMFVGNRKTS